MIKLYSPQNEMELALIKSLFEGEGIDYFVQNEHFAGLHHYPSPGLTGARMIYVPEDQLEAAKQILTDFFGKTRKPAAPSPEGQTSFRDKVRVILETFFMHTVGVKRWGRKDRGGGGSP